MRRNTQSTLKGFSHLLAGLAVAAWVGMAAATSAAALDARNPTASANPSESARAAGRVQAIGPDPGKGFVRLPGHVLSVLAKAEPASQASEQGRDQPMTLTLTLKRDDQSGFERYLRDVYDVRSPHHHHFLSQAQLSNHFGPSRREYASVIAYAEGNGFELVETSMNRMTLTVRGERAAVDRAFQTRIVDYQLGGSRFYANERNPALPRRIAAHVQAVTGLSNFTQVRAAEEIAEGGGLAGLSAINNAYTILDIFNTFLGPNGDADKIWDTANLLSSIAKYASSSTVEMALNPPTYVLHTTPSICPLNGILAATGTTVGPLYARLAAAASAVLYYTPACPPPSNFASPAILRAARLRAARPSAPRASPANATTTPWSGVTGAGQTIGLIEFDSFQTSDVADYLALTGQPASQINQLTQVPVNGGATPGPEQNEVLLDVDIILTAAPGAQVVVYDAPGPVAAGSFQPILNRMINDGVSIISNSWYYCEDQTTLADAQSIDAILASAAASGISVFNASGDSGSTCSDGSANTVPVPADSPNATAVGGTSLTLGPSGGYGAETWWNGSGAAIPSGQGGFGVSQFFPRPSYQSALNSQNYRSIPDVSVNADPSQGIAICQAGGGGCPTGNALGGTSGATAIWAAFQALINQAQGKNMGLVNPMYYALANTGAFHSAASMGSDFSHVGLGSPNLDALYLSSSGQAAGPPDNALSQVGALVPAASLLSLAAPPVVPDDGTNAIVRVQLIDAGGNTVTGRTVSLAPNSGSQATIAPSSGVSSSNDGSVVFTVSDLTPELVTFTATDTSDAVQLTQVASLNFTGPPPTGGGISASPTSVPADGASSATVSVTLQDSLGRGVPGKQISVSQGAGHSDITGPTPSVTNANGTIQFTVTDATSEAVTYTATDVTDAGLAVPGTAQVSFGTGAGGTPPCAAGTAIQVSAGYAVTSFASGFSYNSSCVGPIGVAFDPAGDLYVGNFSEGSLYRFTASGGAAQSATRLTPIPPPLAGTHLAGLTFSKDGQHLYAAEQATGAVVELDPGTGAVLRILTYLNVPTSTAIDPLSGDLFVSEDGVVGFDAVIERIANPQSASPVVTDYVTGFYYADGITFAPDGTLFAEAGGSVYRIGGTNTASPATVTKIASITGADGIAIAVNPASPAQAEYLYVNDNFGNMTRIDLTQSPVVLTPVFTGGSRGDFVAVGPDGCAYATQTDQVLRVSNADGSCPFSPSSAYSQAGPALVLSPASVSPSPAQGSTQTFTTNFQNLSVPAGTAVYFLVTGPNAQVKLARTDAGGSASFTYTGAGVGTDDVVATSSVAIGTPATQTTLASQTTKVNWTAGLHQSLVTVNLSPRGGIVGIPVIVSGSLSDISANPAVPAAGQLLTLTAGGVSCSAVTNANGIASCPITPTLPGGSTLTASFAGSSQLLASAVTVAFNVVAPVTSPAPSVTIAVLPTTVTAGTSATLNWSSTNSTACTASGAWSGAKATSGTLSVAPTTPASYTYVLACSGAGRSASAQATLIVSSAAVTVPNVIAMTQGAATTAITGAGLVVGTVTQQASATVAAGLVISESPTAGSSVAHGSAVNLVVSSGPTPVTVPNVVGLTQAAATSAITGAGLAVGTVTVQSSATVASGHVVSESPAAGTRVATGSKVNLVVSCGPQPIKVPNVVGLGLAAAKTIIANVKLVVQTVQYKSSMIVAAGEVILERPAAGTTVQPGTPVILVVVSGSTLQADYAKLLDATEGATISPEQLRTSLIDELRQVAALWDTGQHSAALHELREYQDQVRCASAKEINPSVVASLLKLADKLQDDAILCSD